MKLAEALVLRRDTQNKLDKLKENLIANTVIQEDDTLDVSNEELIRDYEKVNKLLSDLIIAVNKKNATTRIESLDMTIAEALEAREALHREHKLYSQILEEASNRSQRYSRSEIKMVRTVNTKDISKKVDQLAKKIREFDVAIQQTNWLVDL